MKKTKMMKKTKIICSIGPATQTWEKFKGLVEAGMNVARINFSHATLEERKVVEDLVERARRELGANVAILYDTKGPDLRTCSFINDSIELIKGNKIRIVEEDLQGEGDGTRISFNYRNLVGKLEIGQEILLDDGFYKLIVVSKETDGVTCEIQNSGTIKSRRGVCIPGIHLDVPYVSEKDREDIEYACRMDGDYLAISFVNTVDNIREVRELCRKYGKPNMPIISKVETQYAMDHLKEIVEESDYIMIARGDLGIETGVQNLPLYQQQMIDECHAQGKGVIMATQMMTSMKHNIRPTNAEVTDVSNAVLKGCDAIMTSEETTIGEYPVETIQMMTEIAVNAEKIATYHSKEYKLLGTDIHNTIAKCAVEASKDLPLKAIVASTRSGKTAIDIASLRPNTLIVATVMDEKVARLLALKWGIYTKVVNSLSTTDEIVNSGVNASKELLDLESKDLVAVIGSYPANEHTNFLKIEEI